MAFEWDEKKREANLVKNGVDFRRVPELLTGARSKKSTAAKSTAKPASTVWAKSRAESTPSPTPGAAPTAGSSARGKPTRENRKHTTRVSSDKARHLKDETDYARLDAMTDADIAQAVAEDPDASPLDLDWTEARLSLPPAKDVVTLRLDRDVLEWFRAQGKGYQTTRRCARSYEARRNRQR